ncbi:LysR family transcriptional regulator [Brevibacillus fluminis]|uniref:LysR family transcriptional regulator n=1 Tax=Brevibacillus fluminis TaxID=511487 RepID=A0A3M8DG29_9BACL|nr:LysR family transcriptional regulator [Brevibacillus fluminis]RNB87080.1 LysR family transcriptional regulator [Brevibacillus fluminis]
MNIENIEAFVYVIHFNSFNKAADALFLSQPSISARIQSLERELDARLFDREGRHFSLTEKGKQFLPFAQQILQSYKKGKQYLQQMKTSLHELRIGCTVSVSNYVIPELLPRFKKEYPEIQIKLQTASTESILDGILNKELDLGFVRNVTHPHVDSVAFYEDQIRLFVHKDHPFIDRGAVSIEEVGREPLVFFQCGSLDWMKIHRLFDTLDQPPTIEFHIDNLETAKKLVTAGMGISFLPELCVRREVEEGKLFPITIPSLASLSLRTNLISRKGEGPEFRKLFQELGRGFLAQKQLI